jgi:hypothetical protein
MNTNNFKTIEESKGLWWKTARNGNKYISTTVTIGDKNINICLFDNSQFREENKRRPHFHMNISEVLPNEEAPLPEPDSDEALPIDEESVDVDSLPEPDDDNIPF